MIATDGSAKPNPGPAGWAWAAQAPGARHPEVWAAGPIKHGTNNEAELQALAEALTAIPATIPLEVRMDSQYALNCVSTWVAGFRRRGWKTSKGTPVQNRDLIQHIVQLAEGRDIVYRWVRAHQKAGFGDALNEFVDARAQEISSLVRAGRMTNLGPGWPS